MKMPCIFIVIEMTSEVNEDSSTVFIDPTSKCQFRYYKYFDHIVIQDVETGRINAGKFVKDIARANGKKTDIEAFKRTTDYEVSVEITKDVSLREITDASTYANSDVFIIYNEGFGDNVRGSYAIFEVFQLVALWIDKKHKYEILKLLKAINEVANAIDRSAYEVMDKTIKDLKKQIVDLEAKVATLRTPIDNLREDYLYAKQYGDYFLLKYSDSDPRLIKGYLDDVKMVNAKDVRKLFLQHAKVIGLVERVRHKTDIGTYTNSWMSKVSDLARVFEMLKHVKANAIDSFTVDGTMEQVAKSLAEFKLKPSNRYYRGKIFEYEYALQHQLIPIEFMPQFILNKYKMSHRDKGIDLFGIENNEIVEIYQLKLRSGGYITKDNLATFLLRCEDNRFNNCKNILVLNNCNISKKLLKQLNVFNIEVTIM